MQTLETPLLREKEFNPFVKPGQDFKYSLKERLRDKLSGASQYFSNKLGKVLTRILFPYL